MRVLHARTDGDDTVVDQAGGLRSQGRQVIVVTADRDLRSRVAALGVECRGPRWFLDRLS
jgi:rRNA-processing protein FCF1